MNARAGMQPAGLADPNRNSSGDNAFDLVRHCAAVAVLVSHSFALLGLREPCGFGAWNLGTSAVMVFFALSGYLVTQSWQRNPSVSAFSRKRALRIVPGLLVAVLFTTLLVGPAATTWPLVSYLQSPLTWHYLASNATLINGVDRLPGVFEHNPFPNAVNGSLWSLHYEVLMYALLVATCWLAPRRSGVAVGMVALLAAAAVAAAAAVGVDHHSLAIPLLWRTGMEWDGVRLAQLACAFFVGSAIAALHRHRQVLSWPVAACGVLAVELSHGQPWQMPLACMALPYLVLTAAWHLPRAWRGAWPADYSYGIYIYAFPAQQLLVAFAPPETPWAWLCGAQLAATVLLAALSWHLVEAPALRWKPGGPATLRPPEMSHDPVR